jgi:TonB family protein
MYQEVAEVRIVSPGKIYLPRMDRYPNVSAVSGILPQEGPGQPPSIVGEEGFSESETGEFQPNLSILKNKDNTAKDPAFSGWILPFRLNASSGKSSNFTLRVGGKELEATDEFEGESKDRLNLSDLYSGGLSSIQFNRIKSRKDIRGTRASRLEQSVLDYSENYDISPWVKEVVDKIRNSWSVPPIKESLAMGEVKIYISVSKNGELLSLEIMNSSVFVLFDETALEAVQLSLPFPPLPDGFPYGKLEALLVFQFNE